MCDRLLRDQCAAGVHLRPAAGGGGGLGSSCFGPIATAPVDEATAAAVIWLFGCGPTGSSCFGPIAELGVEPVPAAVGEQPGCGVMPPCTMIAGDGVVRPAVVVGMRAGMVFVAGCGVWAVAMPTVARPSVNTIVWVVRMAIPSLVEWRC
ncbi:hypothetical protein [Lysobacter claricitrinus]|uniref:hypothetical protein n=1 Tax=Lysobacter claricitrinus TaxID=3367728 RepID=UPI0038B351DC